MSQRIYLEFVVVIRDDFGEVLAFIDHDHQSDDSLLLSLHDLHLVSDHEVLDQVLLLQLDLEALIPLELLQDVLVREHYPDVEAAFLLLDLDDLSGESHVLAVRGYDLHLIA